MRKAVSVVSACSNSDCYSLSIVSWPPDKSTYLKINFLISQPKHMFWVLKITVSVKRLF